MLRYIKDGIFYQKSWFVFEKIANQSKVHQMLTIALCKVALTEIVCAVFLAYVTVAKLGFAVK